MRLHTEPAFAPSLYGVCVSLALAQQLAGLSETSRLLQFMPGGAARSAAHGGVWGLGRVLRLEHAALHAQTADVAHGPGVGAARALTAQAAESEVVWRGEARRVARLRPSSSTPKRSANVARGAYSITGGLGGLGLRAAALLADGGACGVSLASRRGLSARHEPATEAQLRMVRATIVACDGSDAVDASALVSVAPPIGVLHAAGAGDKGLLVQVCACRLHQQYAPKAVGAWHLHGATAAAPLEAWLLFSSVGAGLGNVGQASYAAANACLDAHVLSRRARGAAACSVQWPLVGGAGMGAAAYAALAERQVAVVGLAGISLEVYAACVGAQLAASVGLGLSVQLAHRSDVRELLADLADASQPRFGELAPPAAHAATSGSGAVPLSSGGALAHALAPLAPTQRRAHVEGAVLRVVRELTGSAVAALAAETPLMEAGIDSLAATELASRLRALTGVALPPTVVFEQPTARAVASHVVEELCMSAAAVVGAAPALGLADGVEPLVPARMEGQWAVCSELAMLRRRMQTSCGSGSELSTLWALDDAVDASGQSVDNVVSQGVSSWRGLRGWSGAIAHGSLRAMAVFESR